jgi:hypothetical protein
MSNSKFPEKIEEGDESKAPIDKLFDTKRPLLWPFRLLPEARDIMLNGGSRFVTFPRETVGRLRFNARKGISPRRN